jgi:hypothetical protein
MKDFFMHPSRQWITPEEKYATSAPERVFILG